jgi:mono/diheme cytochrome c family protein
MRGRSTGLVIAVVGLLSLAWLGTIAPATSETPAADVANEPTSPPPTAPPLSPEAAKIESGRYLAVAGNCASCHTQANGAAYAGGVAFETDFGTIYSSNITPDTTVGIGAWTEIQFVRAMREGIDADGKHLYPAFPYTSFTKVNDADLSALYAYLKTVPSSDFQAPENALGFPWNLRWLLGLWKWLYFDAGAYQPQSDRDASWNRGAYLVQGLAHCGTCHTPRNFLGAEKQDQFLAGGVYNDKVPTGDVRPWTAVNLTQADSGLSLWASSDLVDYLKTGHSNRAGSLGPMNEVVGNSTRHLKDADIAAMATYIKSLAPIELSKPMSLSASELSEGETQYTIHCGTCHLPTGLGSKPGSELGPSLVGNAIVQAKNPASLINVILYNSEVLTPTPAAGWKTMEGIGDKADDEQVAAIANYVRASWGNRGGKVSAADVAKQR